MEISLTEDVEMAVIATRPVFDPPAFALRLLTLEQVEVPEDLPEGGEWFLLTRAQVERLLRVARRAIQEADQIPPHFPTAGGE